MFFSHLLDWLQQSIALAESGSFNFLINKSCFGVAHSRSRALSSLFRTSIMEGASLIIFFLFLLVLGYQKKNTLSLSLVDGQSVQASLRATQLISSSGPVKCIYAIHAGIREFTRNFCLAAWVTWSQESNSDQLSAEQRSTNQPD